MILLDGMLHYEACARVSNNDKCDCNARLPGENDNINNPTNVDVEKEPVKEEPMTRLFGIQPGGGILNVYQFDPEELGSIGHSRVSKLRETLRKDRRAAFSDTRAILRAYDLIKADEEVQYLAIGCNKLGRDLLIVVTVVKGGPM